MNFQLDSLGTAVPSVIVTQEDAARMVVEHSYCTGTLTKVIPALYRRAGVRTRHSVLLAASSNGGPPHQTFFHRAHDEYDLGPTTGERMRRYEVDALELVYMAARTALRGASCRKEEIAHLVTVSCTGFFAPGIDVGLMQRLGLSADISHTHLGFMGCHGALSGLRVGSALARSDPSRSVLVCCVELCSLHHQYTHDAEGIVANSLFSDGAAAIVGRTVDSRGGEWQIADQRSCLLPNTVETIGWQIRDHGFEMHLSPKVPDVIRQALRPWVTCWLAEHDLTISDVCSWAIHPGGPRVITACGESLELRPDHLEVSREVLAEHGNMSSPTIVFILENLRQQSAALPCVALSFGPGLTIEAALIL